MSNNTHPPFAVGQKVVRIGKTVEPYVINGEVYTVCAQRQCPGCSNWKVSVLGLPSTPKDQIGKPDYCSCGEIMPKDEFYYGRAEGFAPIHPAQADITKQLATQPVEERLDVPINEPILS